MNDCCDNCVYCLFLKEEHYDCYDVTLYECEANDLILDEFQTPFKKCSKYTSQDWWKG